MVFWSFWSTTNLAVFLPSLVDFWCCFTNDGFFTQTFLLSKFKFHYFKVKICSYFLALFQFLVNSNFIKLFFFIAVVFWVPCDVVASMKYRLCSASFFGSSLWLFNPFVPNVFFLYPLKTENRKVTWCLQGIKEGCIGNKWVKLTLLFILSSIFCICGRFHHQICQAGHRSHYFFFCSRLVFIWGNDRQRGIVIAVDYACGSFEL